MTKLGLENINIFEDTFTSRFRYNGKTSVKTCFGAVCTGLYILVMLAFTVYYTVPIAYKENPKTKTVTVSTSEDKELKYSEYGPIYFGVYSPRSQWIYNRSMINVYLNYTEYETATGRDVLNRKYRFRKCTGNPF